MQYIYNIITTELYPKCTYCHVTVYLIALPTQLILNSSFQFQLDQATVGKEQIQELIRRIKLNQYLLASLMAQVCQASYRWRQPEYQLLPLYLAAKNLRWFKITLQLLSYYLAASEELKYYISFKMAFDQNSIWGVRWQINIRRGNSIIMHVCLGCLILLAVLFSTKIPPQCQYFVQNSHIQVYSCTTQPHSEGGRIFAYKGVGQLAYKGVGHEVTPLQASAKYHAFQPCFLAINPSNTTIFFGYILDTSHLQGG
ncbi:Hypothetical_protein [Hexamita inflata]|uniref:Hypothetical_protein n=1 Tax=Hexamita inflata TaxID=28002 RepID=A0AA86NVL5_9EUKA|nr:Hypothetical protein HINF_LOCUS14102 [Hexamita inflata]CAI9926461.1 Hypothetical protein HINF_LOCUS14106 [Hexamita inflata]